MLDRLIERSPDIPRIRPKRALRTASGFPPFKSGFPAFAARSSKIQ